MSPAVYFDTSALAKWYLNEAGSEEVEAYLRAHGPVAISDLTVVEMQSLLARRRRDREIAALLEGEVLAAFREDMRHGHLVRHPLPQGWAEGAGNLLSSLPRVPLRTLDAIHLVAALETGAETLATCDRVMAAAAKSLGLAVVRF